MRRRKLLCLLAAGLFLIIALSGCAADTTTKSQPVPVPNIADVTRVELTPVETGRIVAPLDPASSHDRAVIEKLLGWLRTAEVTGRGQDPAPNYGGRAVLTLQLKNGKAVSVREYTPRDQRVVFDTGDGNPLHLNAPAVAKWLNGQYSDDLSVMISDPPPPVVTRLRDYTPVKLALSDYRDAVRDLVANPDPAIVDGLRASGASVDYPSPRISPTPGYRLTVRGPNGEEAELSYVGDGSWWGPTEYFEGKALADAVQKALPVPVRKPGDLEYLFGATELKATTADSNWQLRRQVVVRVLRDAGSPEDGAAVPSPAPQLKLSFTVNGKPELVEVWADAFRYGGRVYPAKQVLERLSSAMSAG